MKIHLKFDHNKEELLAALDCDVDSEKANYQIKGVIKKCLDDDTKESSSQLAEMIHNELDYSVILFLATKNLEQKMEELMKIELRNFLGL